MNRPSSGVAITSGRPVVSQCAAALAATASSSGVLAHQDQVERAVLVIGGEQPVERQQTGEQRAEPQDRRPDPAEQRQIGADGERHQHRRRSGRTARRCRRRRRPGSPSRMSRMKRAASGLMPALRAAAPSRASSPIGPWVAATISPPPARCCRIRPARRVLGLAVERRGRLVEQPDRPLHGHQARDREPPPLPGRQIGGRQVGQRHPGPTAASAAISALGAAEIARPEAEVFGDRQRRLQRVLVAEVVGLLRDGSFRIGVRSAPAGPPAIRTRPAIMRSSDDLPAPLRPVTSRASPPATRKLKPAEDLAAAADAGQAARLKPHRRSPFGPAGIGGGAKP